ncbi:MAG: hypothetical protein RL148_309 [Planctomycetota bacterium]
MVHTARSASTWSTLLRASALALWAGTAACAQVPLVNAAGETMRLLSSSVAAGTAAATFTVTLTVDNDNSDAALPTSFRRWWHCEIGNLDTAGTTLQVRVASAGYTDIILPVWSLSTDGVNFGPYVRCPVSAVPVYTSSQHRFTLVTPPGVRAVRLAKFFPYSVARKDAWLQSLAAHPRRVATEVLGASAQGRPIHMLTFTDASVPATDKKRVWIHAGVHPSETPAYFACEGLVAWLGSGAPLAEALMDAAIVHVVPMPNPDGVFLGNYRTTSTSVNLEEQWSAPYASTVPEIVALRTRIEQYMGTVAAPGSNPVSVLLNLHSTHNVAYPFHFRHVSNANWQPGTTSSGVIPVVHAAEQRWIDALVANSPFTARGTTQNSTLGTRPYVESMMHDRWTAVPGWLTSPSPEDPVMAITWEGTYGRGADGTTWGTEQDHRDVGTAMGISLAQYYGVTLGSVAESYGASCGTSVMAGTIRTSGTNRFVDVLVGGAPASALGWLAIGFTQQNVPLPVPYGPCPLLTDVVGTAGLSFSPVGTATTSLLVPPIAGLSANLQAIAADFTGPVASLGTSNGVRVRNTF